MMISKTLRIWGCGLVIANSPPAAFIAFWVAMTTRTPALLMY